MVVGGLDITDKYIRARQVEPNEFDTNTFRTIRLASGIKAIIGKKKGEKSTSIQSILFDKKKYTPESSKAWLAKHKEKFTAAVRLEEQKTDLFADEFEPDFQNHLVGHLPPLTEAQISRLLELIDESDEDDEEPEEEEMKYNKFCLTV